MGRWGGDYGICSSYRCALMHFPRKLAFSCVISFPEGGFGGKSLVPTRPVSANGLSDAVRNLFRNAGCGNGGIGCLRRETADDVSAYAFLRSACS